MSVQHAPAKDSYAGGLDPAIEVECPAAVVDELSADAGLIGIRHHSPALAAAMPALLAAARPDLVLVELPSELEEWLPWLVHPDTTAPVALAAAPDVRAGDTGVWGGTAFYPFADFSPELAALRWAARQGIPFGTCDLPLAARSTGAEQAAPASAAPADRAPGLLEALRANLSGRPNEDPWDRLVEAAAPGSTPEQLRRAALLVGWALRQDAARRGAVTPGDLAREEWMRTRVAAARAEGRRVAVVVGAFHTPALAGPGEQPATPATAPTEPVREPDSGPPFVTSLIPYTYPLLDERSGYPAGIRDPEWQHCVLEAAGDPTALEVALTRTAVAVCAQLRASGHPCGPADAKEITRLATDLARLRGLPSPGRGEFVEAVQSVLAQGEPLGRGRAVAAALGKVLVGSRTGRAAADAPRSGLAPAVEAELGHLGLPGPARPPAAPELIRLDPLRSARDRQREVLLQRLAACGVPYAERVATLGAGGTEALGTRWRVAWSPSVAAMLPVAGVWGVTLEQAAEGALRAARRRQDEEGGPTPAQAIAALEAAAECGLPALSWERLEEFAQLLPTAGTLQDLLDAMALADRVRHAHIPGLPPPTDRQEARLHELAELLTQAALRALDGLAGSEDPTDARTVVELGDRADAAGGVRLARGLAALAARGTPMMRGAADAVRVLLGHEEASRLGDRVASWVDRAESPEGRARLQQGLTGLLTAAGALLDAAPDALSPLLDRVAELPDHAFATRLPALRGGFDTLGPAARERLLTLVEDRLGTQVEQLDGTPAWATADLAARAAVDRLGLMPPPPELDAVPISSPSGTNLTKADPISVAPGPRDVREPRNRQSAAPDHALPLAVRWRLLLGRPLPPNSTAASGSRLACALDELYGSGHGEGSGPGIESRTGGSNRSGNRGGREAPFPGIRQWAEELEALFGTRVREEVLAAAVARGRGDALLELDPAAARPSVELLRTVLSHAGSLPEGKIARLRPLVARLVAELSAQLASRLRPALTGLVSARPSRRPTGPLDLRRTIQANMATARPGPDGRMAVLPERPVFRSRSRRSADWRLILVVDVSGSMEASTIWAALTASIMAGVPTVSTHFLAFSTEVVDFTDRITDPLSLLLEVRVGGGTHIAAGLRAARDLVTVPSRTLIAVISDFEEGYPLGGLLAETRHLVGMGCHLIGCASLDDTGAARYSAAIAGQLVAAGMPVAALSPTELARWVGDRIR